MLKYSPKLPFYTEKDNKQKSKECALILCNEIKSIMISFHSREIENNYKNIDYWYEVEKEIVKL